MGSRVVPLETAAGGKACDLHCAMAAGPGTELGLGPGLSLMGTSTFLYLSLRCYY